MKSLLLPFFAATLLASPAFADWDPEDTTFDPTIAETIANGSSRIGDPAPVRQDSYDIVGYTYLQAKEDPNSGVLVWVSFIIPTIPGDTRPPGGAAMFLPIEKAEILQGLLKKAIEIAGTEEKKEVGAFVEIPGYESWKIGIDGSTKAPIVFYHTRGKDNAVYRMSLNPSKKLLDALSHFIVEGKKIAAENK